MSTAEGDSSAGHGPPVGRGVLPAGPEVHPAHAISARPSPVLAQPRPGHRPCPLSPRTLPLFHDPARTTLTLADFLAYFTDVETERDGWAVSCPAHLDARPSLRVAYNAEAKKIALRCRVGCSTEDVLGSLGLTMAALFDVEPGARDDPRTADAGAAEIATASRGVRSLRENPTMMLIRRPLIAPAYSGQPAARPAPDPVLFIRSRPATDATDATEPQDTEATPCGSCPACEGFAEALARIEDKLTSLLHEVERLRDRMDKVLGP